MGAINANGELQDAVVPVNNLIEISSSFTRPNDTNAYTAGDVVEDSTSAPTSLSIAGAGRVDRGSGTIIAACLYDSANQATKGQFEVWLFEGTYTPDNDNAAFTPTDAEVLTALQPLAFNTSYVGDATAGAGGNCFYPLTNLNIPYKCPSGSRNLAWALVARNAYTPVANEIFTLRLFIVQD